MSDICDLLLSAFHSLIVCRAFNAIYLLNAPSAILYNDDNVNGHISMSSTCLQTNKQTNECLFFPSSTHDAY